MGLPDHFDPNSCLAKFSTMSYAKVRDVPADKFIKAYAAHLKANDKLQVPTWVDLVKTAPHKELPPYDPDWYYVRAAAIARRVYLRQGLGVGALRKQFGDRNANRGTHPEKHALAAGGVIRHILIQFEQNNLMEKTTTKGRPQDDPLRSA